MSLIERSRENLSAAQLCMRSGLLSPAVSRYYYAVYQAAVCLFDERGVTEAAAKRVERIARHLAALLGVTLDGGDEDV